MADIVKRLREVRGLPFREKHRCLFTQAANEIERLQRIIDSRPAINAGLPESYVLWSQSIYELEFVRATDAQS